MFELLQMWALVEVLGIACLPLAVNVFHNLPDRGWAFSKALGLAVFAFLVWCPLMWLHFLPFSQVFIAGVAFVLFILAVIGWIYTRHTIVKLVHRHMTYVVAAELVFLGMVCLLGWVRSYGPDIRSFEMFMDEGFIAGIMRSPHLPPNDMWFAGFSINYYYYAHFTIAVLAKLIGQSPSIAFNTGICIFFGLTAVNIFGVSCNVVAWARHLRVGVQTEVSDELAPPEPAHFSLLHAIPYGLLSMLMGLVLGNLAATQQWWQNHGEGYHFDWYAPSRVITKTINEFPAFSFLLSCFHAHVLALAFTILAIGLAFNLFLERDGKGLSIYGRGWRLPCTLVITALVLGGLFTMNGWDFPTYLGLTLICVGIQQWLAYQARFELALVLDVVVAALSLITLSLLLYLPFYLTFISPAQGLGLVQAADRSQLRDELLIYGLFAFIFLSLMLVSAVRRPLFEEKLPAFLQSLSLQRTGLLGIVGILLVDLALLLLMPNSLAFVVMGSVAVIAFVLALQHLGDRAHAFTLLLGALAFGLVAFCEVVFLKDVFASNFPRMNTVFKFYFQAWALLAIASGCGMFFLVESFRPFNLTTLRVVWPRRLLQGVWVVLLLGLFLASTIYPLLAPTARYTQVDPLLQTSSLQQSNSLDGLAYLQTCRPPDCPYDTSGDYAAIRWLNEHVQGDAPIVESIGDDYSVWGRVSALTGLPSPMGWIGHEYQWRVNWYSRDDNSVEFERRRMDVDTIYTSTDSELVLATMARYHAQYLYVGPLEYMKYAHVDLHRFGAFMQIVYNAKDVTIYKVR